ncbi:MAG TPA: hypothetical protein VE244_17410 [Nitrososphaeraceae archaeon]|nr:hypothetical protein [Nitrososphaeraceae archaeon]
MLWDYDFVNSTEVYYEDGSSIRFFQTKQNCTLLITSYFSNYIYEYGTIYISQQQQHEKKKQKRNEKKRLKD